VGDSARTTAQGVTKVIPAGKEHVASIVRIERESFSDPWSEQAFLGLIESPLALLAVAVGSDDQVVGYAAAAGIGGDGEILNVAVDASARRKGIGGDLLDWAIGELRGQLVAKIFLEVRASNAAAIALYGSRGFAQISERKNYYRRPAENAVVMKLNLGTAK
jgi:ribosomal-protein-alanine N-acetyltransferase